MRILVMAAVGGNTGGYFDSGSNCGDRGDSNGIVVEEVVVRIVVLIVVVLVVLISVVMTVLVVVMVVLMLVVIVMVVGGDRYGERGDNGGLL